jgi:hypothetical protein
MTLFQIMDTHPFASGLAVGMMLTFATMMMCAGLLKLLLRANNSAPSLALPQVSSNQTVSPIPPIGVSSASSTISARERPYSAVDLPQQRNVKRSSFSASTFPSR